MNTPNYNTVWLDTQERAEIAEKRGYRLATCGDPKPTHGICRHGRIVSADADDHTCSWTLLVSIDPHDPC
jgi:hypothetical protein